LHLATWDADYHRGCACRLAVQEALYDSNDARVQTRSAVITSALAAILSVVVLLILSLMHERLAIKLTEWGI
jgi:hypothetical protein